MTPEQVKKKIETELKIQGKSKNTIRMYTFYNLGLLKQSNKPVADITTDDIKEYLANLISENNNDPASIALARAALRFFYDEVLKKKIVAEIKTPKKQKKIPEVLTKEEISLLFNAAKKHDSKIMLGFLYGSGLRVSECASLKWSDINFDEKLGRLKHGKGAKDRLFILSDKLLEDLIAYRKQSTGEYLFENNCKSITSRRIQRRIKILARKSGIKKDVHAHTLRHSFATHLIESGVDVRVIQELLAHSNLQTTQIYTHISTKMIKSVKSPMDD